jgi:hypothetical protein
MRKMRFSEKILVCFLTMLLALCIALQGKIAFAQDNGQNISSPWNDFKIANMLPGETEVQAHAVVKAIPTIERQTSISRIARVLNAKYLSPDFAENLLPLKEWTISVSNMPISNHPNGNVFLARKNLGTYLLQVTEGLGYVMVDIRKADGTPLLQPGADLFTYAINAAKEWLCDSMQPAKCLQRIDARWAPGVATWITADVPESDNAGFVLERCRAITDGTFLRYEIRGYCKRSSIVFAPPPPYTFSEYPPVVPEVAPTNTAKPQPTPKVPNPSPPGDNEVN